MLDHLQVFLFALMGFGVSDARDFEGFKRLIFKSGSKSLPLIEVYFASRIVEA